MKKLLAFVLALGMFAVFSQAQDTKNMQEVKLDKNTAAEFTYPQSKDYMTPVKSDKFYVYSVPKELKTKEGDLRKSSSIFLSDFNAAENGERYDGTLVFKFYAEESGDGPVLKIIPEIVNQEYKTPPLTLKIQEKADGGDIRLNLIVEFPGKPELKVTVRGILYTK